MQCSILITHRSYNVSDSAFTTATIKGPFTNQMSLIYPIKQSDAHRASERLGAANLRESF
jgi:hypothetical protein